MGFFSLNVTAQCSIGHISTLKSDKLRCKTKFQMYTHPTGQFQKSFYAPNFIISVVPTFNSTLRVSFHKSFIRYFFTVEGCANPMIPQHGWMSRIEDNKVAFGCFFSDSAWSMGCYDRQDFTWSGVSGLCPAGS